MPIWLCALYFYFFSSLFFPTAAPESIDIIIHIACHWIQINTVKKSILFARIANWCFDSIPLFHYFFCATSCSLFCLIIAIVWAEKNPRLHVECIFFHYFFSYYPFRTLFFMLCSNIWCSIIKFFLMCNLREERKVWMCNCSCLYEFKFEFIEELELMLWLRFKEAFGAFFRAFGNA